MTWCASLEDKRQWEAAQEVSHKAEKVGKAFCFFGGDFPEDCRACLSLDHRVEDAEVIFAGFCSFGIGWKWAIPHFAIGEVRECRIRAGAGAQGRDLPVPRKKRAGAVSGRSVCLLDVRSSKKVQQLPKQKI